MATRVRGGTESPSSSSVLLSLGRRSRRGSFGSISTSSQIDKDTLNHALDQIHSTASQCESLTTFNEFQSPPAASAGGESKGIANELQGGLSGLYSRFRSSVGNARDLMSSVSEGVDAVPQSPKPKTPTPTPTTKQFFDTGKPSAAPLAVPTVYNDLSARMQAPFGVSDAGELGKEKSAGTKPSKSSSVATAASSKISSASGKAVKSPLMTPIYATASSAAGPAVVELNVGAVKNLDIIHAVAPSSRGVNPITSENQQYQSAEMPVKTTKQAKLVDRSSTGGDIQFSNQVFDQTSIGACDEKAVKLPIQDNDPRISPTNVEFGNGEERVTKSDLDGQVESNAVPTGLTPVSSHLTTGAVLSTDDLPVHLSEHRRELTPSSQGSTPESSGHSPEPDHPAPPTLVLPSASKSHTSRPGISFSSTTSSVGASSVQSIPTHRDPGNASGAADAIERTYTRDSNKGDSAPGTSKTSVYSQMKGRVLSKEYWMRDENARDCFYCGDPFSTFRRKHHCRTCGQIFDSKCTSLVPGTQFGQSSSLRVCKPCEGIINGYDDSSEFSDDSSAPMPGLRPRHGSTSASDVSPAKPTKAPSATVDSAQESLRHDDRMAPTMAIPATRRAGHESNRRSAILEIDAVRSLARPSSSRSLKTSTPRSLPTGHRRHNSRHLLQRSFKPVPEERAPFHKSPLDEIRKGSRLPAFHSDNIIDPDLEPYLSDDQSSGDEQVSIMAAMNGDGMSRSYEHDKNSLAGFLASAKKGRSRLGTQSISGLTLASRDADNVSLSSTKRSNARNSKRRNLSVSGNILLRPSPRTLRASTPVPSLTGTYHDSLSISALAQVSSPGGTQRMIRSSSMKGDSAPPLELNNASVQHVRKLLRQLLQDSEVQHVNRWENALVPILLQATDDVNPDVQNGDDIDIRHYVKLKKIPGGRPGDTSYVSGLVFTKNLALKSMTRKIKQPNILILTFPLEYARHQRHFMSLEPVIRQEREFLQNLVHRIAALRPQLLLVEQNVSGLALEFLDRTGIATAYNVKASVLEAVSRCCQTRIISSIDKLAIKPAHAGTCADFYMNTYVHGGRRKTYMFLTGCPKELGCTIVLRGADNNFLSKIKRITEFMIYVVYNLKLETCLMRDEFALIPSYSEVGSAESSQVGMPERWLDSLQAKSKSSSVVTQSLTSTNNELVSSGKQNVHSDVSNADVLSIEKSTLTQSDKTDTSISDEIQMPEDIPMPTFYGDMVEKHKTKILSASPFVNFMQPYLLMKAREQERRLVYLKRLRDQDVIEEQKTDGEPKPQKFDLIKPDMVHATIEGTSKKVREVLHAVHDAEYDKALHNYNTQKKQWETYISSNINLFDPYAHQNIAVLYSVVCTVTSVPCSGPDLLALGFYNEHETDAQFEADCTLGQYVEDLCLGATTVCTANGCEKKMFGHHRQYVHGEAQLSVFVEPHACRLRGLQDTILMWSTCRTCGKETQVLPMSDSTWKYSFGKYLELSFWSRELHARAGVCPHDLHRNHIRYFGFKDIALRIQHDPINLLEIIVPRTRITWKVDNDLRFKNDIFTKTEERLNKFMVSVKNRVKSINIESVLPEKAEDCRDVIDKLAKRANDEHLALTRRLQSLYMNSKYFEIIPLNRAVRTTQEKVAEWDNVFADFDYNFFPSEKDISRLATLQLRKIFLDRDDSVVSLTSTDEGTVNSDEYSTEKTSPEDTPTLAPQTRKISPEKAHDMLTSVVERHSNADDGDTYFMSAPPTSKPLIDSKSEKNLLQGVDKELVQQLDLAVPQHYVGVLKDAQTSFDPALRPVSPVDSKTSGNNGDSGQVSNESMLKGSSDFHGIERSSTNLTIGSNIPRPSIQGPGRRVTTIAPPLSRAQSQPVQIRHEQSSSSGRTTPTGPPTSISTASVKRMAEASVPTASDVAARPGEKKVPDRLGVSTLKHSGVSAHSMIPRSIAGRRKDSRVSTLAKHFEQLSREFEKERLRERRQRAAKSRQSRAYPMASSKPIVEVYKNVHEAVEEREPSDEDLVSTESSQEGHRDSPATADTMARNTHEQTPGHGFHAEDTLAESTSADESTTFDSRIGSDAEADGIRSDDEHEPLDDIQIPDLHEAGEMLLPNEAQLDLKLDLPKHEKTSLMKMLTNFWAERSASGWQPLEYPLNVSDHVFADSDIIVREDEPSSLIAFALGSGDYQAKLRSIQEKSGGLRGRHKRSHLQDPLLDTEEQAETEQSLLRSTGTHLKYQFQEGSAKMLCKIFYAEQFDAVRRKCGVSERIVESLSRCLKWDSKGGKTKSVFLKTLDDRFVLKSLSQIETQAFLRFAPAYFQIMSEALFHELPSVIAKMLGFYQIIIKNPVTGVEFNWFLLIMENLFYDRAPTRIFDLKGSMRNRRIQSTGEQNEVLLDENMVEFIYESPLFAREHSKKLLRASVWNDTLFLARQNVMDYSLMIAIDETRKELVVGIIDCIRTYTWDKKLESWIKDRGKNRPTVTSPKEYKSRFREAMGRYVLQAPK